MIVRENRCCDCAVPGYPCRGAACPRRNAEVHYCDSCGEEIDEIYEVEAEELCEECLKERFRKDR